MKRQIGYVLYWLILTLMAIASAVIAVLQYPVYLRIFLEGK